MAAKKTAQQTGKKSQAASKPASKPTKAASAPRTASKASTDTFNPKPKQRDGEKPKRIVLVTPAGVAAYSWLKNPDVGKKYSDGKYKLTLVLDKEDDAAVEFCKKLVAMGAKKLIKNGDVIAEEKDKEEFKGKYLITAKSKHQPKMIDAKRIELPSNVFPMSGDVVKIAIVPNEYEDGKWNLYLNAVQLLKKNARGFEAGDYFDEEDGFEAPAQTSNSDDGEGKKPSHKPADDLDF